MQTAVSLFAVAGCDQQECCPLDTFVAATKDRVPVDWEAECKNPNSNPDDDDDDLLTGECEACLRLFLFAHKQQSVIDTCE